MCAVNEASDGVVDSVANRPKGLGEERVGEEAEPELMPWKPGAKPRHSRGRWLEGRCGFLAPLSKRTGTARRNPSTVEHPHRAVALRSALLHP